MKKFKIIATFSKQDLENLHLLKLKGVDIAEIRLDLLDKKFIEQKLSSYLQNLHKPLLFTYRLPEDSALKVHSSLKIQNVISVLKKFNYSKNYIDFDLKQRDFFGEFLNELKHRRIYSLHNFDGTYTYQEMLSQIQSVNDKNGVYKFATFPKTFSEGLNFLESIKKLSKKFCIIGVWMGEMGSFSRIFGDMFGSSFTYATLSEPKAPGQVSVDLILKFRKTLL